MALCWTVTATPVALEAMAEPNRSAEVKWELAALEPSDTLDFAFDAEPAPLTADKDAPVLDGPALSKQFPRDRNRTVGWAEFFTKPTVTSGARRGGLREKAQPTLRARPIPLKWKTL